MSWKLMRFRDFLKRSKIPIEIQDNEFYKRVTIKIKHNGVSLRDEEIGKQIGTKKQFVLKAGQFILSKIDARYGAFGIAPEEVDGAIITGNFWAYDVDFSLVNIDWFNQFTNSQDFYDLCERASSGITHRKYLNEDSFLDNEIYLPSPEEQLQIIEEFKENRESINILSTELTHQLDLVKQLRQAFLREAMQGKLIKNEELKIRNEESGAALLEKIKVEKERLIKEGKIKKQNPLPPITEEEVPFEIPENWVWCRLGDITFIRSGIALGKKFNGLTREIPYLRVANVQRGSLDLSRIKYLHLPEETISKYLLKHNEILVNEGGDFDKVGRCAIWNSEIESCVHQNHIFAVQTINVVPKFIENAINSDSSQSFFLSKYKKSTNLASLNKTNLSLVPLPIPPLSEQQRIVVKLDELMAYCDDLDASIKDSQQQNELLLQQVLREALEPSSLEGRLKKKETVG